MSTTPGSVINKADLNVSASGVNRAYDGTVVASVNYGDDRIAGDVLQVAGTSLFADKDVGTGKTVDITNIHLTGTDAGNYNVVNSTASTSADITQKALIIRANNDTRFADNSVYSGGNGVSYNGFVANENASVLGGAWCMEAVRKVPALRAITSLAHLVSAQLTMRSLTSMVH